MAKKTKNEETRKEVKLSNKWEAKIRKKLELLKSQIS